MQMQVKWSNKHLSVSLSIQNEVRTFFTNTLMEQVIMHNFEAI